MLYCIGAHSQTFGVSRPVTYVPDLQETIKFTKGLDTMSILAVTRRRGAMYSHALRAMRPVCVFVMTPKIVLSGTERTSHVNLIVQIMERALTVGVGGVLFPFTHRITLPSKDLPLKSPSECCVAYKPSSWGFGVTYYFMPQMLKIMLTACRRASCIIRDERRDTSEIT